MFPTESKNARGARVVKLDNRLSVALLRSVCVSHTLASCKVGIHVGVMEKSRERRTVCGRESPPH